MKETSGSLTQISSRYQIKVTKFTSPSPGATLQIAQQDSKRWAIGFFTQRGNDISLTTNPDPATGDFFDLIGGDNLQLTFNNWGPLVTLPWFLGTSSGGAPCMVIEVIDTQG